MTKSKDESRRRYPEELAARRAVIDRLSQHFEFWEEVKALGVDGDTFRIDAVSRCIETDWIFGWEFKRSSLFKNEFASALRQGIHYRFARINDPRLPSCSGMQLPAIVLFPDWLGDHDDDNTDYSGEAEGMRLVAAQLRVGTMRETDRGFSLIMGQSRIWHSSSGWTKTAEDVLFGKRGFGATRRQDNHKPNRLFS